MKRIMAIILILLMVLSFTGCEKVMYDEDDFVERARKEFHIADAETIEIKYIGEIIKGDKALMWFMSGKEYQAHRYVPIRCEITENGGRRYSDIKQALTGRAYWINKITDEKRMDNGRRHKAHRKAVETEHRRGQDREVSERYAGHNCNGRKDARCRGAET